MELVPRSTYSSLPPFHQIPKQHYKSQNHNSLDVRNDQVRVGDRVAENGTSMLARIVFGVLLDW
jgi:hypothetical protein